MTQHWKQTIKYIDKQFGTPAYLYCVDMMQGQYEKIRSKLTTECDVFYSMKANPLLGICQYFAKQQLGCEVSSKNELLIALKAGFPKNKIIFVGPGKTNEDLTLCIKNHIKAIVCESIDEVIRINQIAKTYRRSMPVMIRINPSFQIKNAPIRMSGVPTQFGIGIAEFNTNIKKIQSCQHIKIIGIQIYNGSRILDYTAVLENMQNILNLASHLSNTHKIKFDTIDLGGGIGVRYFENESNFDTTQFVIGLNHLLQDYRKKQPKTRFIIELGRYLVAEAGSLITQVIATKKNHEKEYAVINAGMHCLLSATGGGTYLQRNYLTSHFPLQFRMRRRQLKRYHIAGPLCTPGDVLIRDQEFQTIFPGDFILFHHVGAYGYTASPNRFLSHDMPVEILEYNQHFHLARQRESFREITQAQKDLSSLYC